MDSIKNIIKSQVPEEKTLISKSCSKHGDYEAEKTVTQPRFEGRKPSVRITRCPACMDEHDAKMIAEYRLSIKHEIKDSISTSGIPARYRNINIRDITPSCDNQATVVARCKRYAEKFKELEALGSSLIFTGGPGTGKTMVALSMIPLIIEFKLYMPEEEVVKRATSGDTRYNSTPNFCKYVNVYDLFAQIKSTFRKGSAETEADILKIYCGADLLILDEVGVQMGTEFESMTLFRIINKRYENMKPTILISNLSETDLAEYVGQRTIDRFYENHGAVFVCDWDSYRKK